MRTALAHHATLEHTAPLARPGVSCAQLILTQTCTVPLPARPAHLRSSHMWAALHALLEIHALMMISFPLIRPASRPSETRSTTMCSLLHVILNPTAFLQIRSGCPVRRAIQDSTAQPDGPDVRHAQQANTQLWERHRVLIARLDRMRRSVSFTPNSTHMRSWRE
jgi:hypothetical protein